MTVAARAARHARVTAMLDYEQARLQQSVCCRFAHRVLVPEVIPPERLRRLGARARKVVRYAGIKEEYALADFEPDPAVLAELGRAIRRDPSPWCARRRSSRSTTAWRTRCSRVLRRLRRPGAHRRAAALPAAARGGAPGLGGSIVPEQAIDAQSLVAAADLVVSAGGTMNREAVVLGTPVYTGFAGRMGAVDETLIREGRLRRLVSRRASSETSRPRSARGAGGWLRRVRAT